MRVPLLVLVLVAAALIGASAQSRDLRFLFADPTGGGDVCTPGDTSLISSTVRAAVRADDIFGVAGLLVASGDVVGLGKGFRFPPEDRAAEFTTTSDRSGDGDVIAFKAIAQAAMTSGDAEKLADVIMAAITPPGCDFPSGVDPASIRDALRDDLADFDLMLSYLNADPTTDYVPSSGRRKLTVQGGSPVNTWVCAHCWPGTSCAKTWWCKKD